MSEPGGILAAVVREIRLDYQNAPRLSMAYKTAAQFVDGAQCEHLVCGACTPISKDPHGYWARGDWFETNCELMFGDSCRCGHKAYQHFVATFDWKEWRDHVCSLLGITPEYFVALVKS